MSTSIPTFAFCGKYSGKEPAVRWLKRLEYELRSSRGGITPLSFLQSVDLLLVDEAVEWAESTPGISSLLKSTSPTDETVAYFRSLFTTRFPSKVTSEFVPPFFPQELDDLSQGEDSLTAYYQRTFQLTHRFGARDRLGAPLTTLESCALDLIVAAFLRGLSDQELRKEATRGISIEKSIHSAFTAAEGAYRSGLIIKKLEVEETTIKEASFYKEIVKRNVSSTYLQSAMASYQKNGDLSRVPKQHLLPPPPPTGDRRLIEYQSVVLDEQPDPRLESPQRYFPQAKSVSFGVPSILKRHPVVPLVSQEYGHGVSEYEDYDKWDRIPEAG